WTENPLSACGSRAWSGCRGLGSGSSSPAAWGAVVLIPPGVPHKFVTAGEACSAISVFHPALAVGPGADIVLAT
ncbi:MAG: hypothetical protein FD126_3027, partial [Elusimicrobia bacterium]